MNNINKYALATMTPRSNRRAILPQTKRATRRAALEWARAYQAAACHANQVRYVSTTHSERALELDLLEQAAMHRNGFRCQS
jgi:hypothetical protein